MADDQGTPEHRSPLDIQTEALRENAEALMANTKALRAGNVNQADGGAFGTIACHLVWSDRTQAVVMLAAIPPIGSYLLVEDDDGEIISFVVESVSILVKRMDPQAFFAHENLPRFVNIIKILLRMEGMAVFEENAEG
jgi:hypothetical protein